MAGVDVKAEEKILYDGMLSKFNKIDARMISISGEEKLTFTILFPKEAGNEFQGVAAEVEFMFYAEGALGGIIPVDGGVKLPVTATDI